MKITKLVHSCLLVEDSHNKVLIDPGSYSWQDTRVQELDLSGITHVAITHTHPDHFDDNFIRAIYESSPDAKWYGKQEAIDALHTLGIVANTSSDDTVVRFVTSAHADLSPWLDTQPDHASYIILDTLLVSGDSHTLTSMHGASILAGAINGGPWGAVVGFIKMIQGMPDKPKLVLPLHDWHWNEQARVTIYAHLGEVLGNFDISFIPLNNIEAQEL